MFSGDTYKLFYNQIFEKKLSSFGIEVWAPKPEPV